MNTTTQLRTNPTDPRREAAEAFLVGLKAHVADAVREELDAVLAVFDTTSAQQVEFAVDHGGQYATTFFVDRDGRMSVGRPLAEEDLGR